MRRRAGLYEFTCTESPSLSRKGLQLGDVITVIWEDPLRGDGAFGARTAMVIRPDGAVVEAALLPQDVRLLL